jgi:hypothetical protein
VAGRKRIPKPAASPIIFNPMLPLFQRRETPSDPLDAAILRTRIVVKTWKKGVRAVSKVLFKSICRKEVTDVA